MIILPIPNPQAARRMRRLADQTARQLLERVALEDPRAVALADETVRLLLLVSPSIRRLIRAAHAIPVDQPERAHVAMVDAVLTAARRRSERGAKR